MNRLCLLLSLLMAFAVASCVYDIHPAVVGEAGYVAIEGDILIGDTSRFDVRLSTDLESKKNVGECVDCTRISGGTKVRPSWWPNDHK